MQTACADLRRTLGRGELLRVAYRLGRSGASGVLTLAVRAAPGSRPEVFVLRRGAAVCAEGESARRSVIARLARAAAEPALAAVFEAGVAPYPPGAVHQVALAGWARSHAEAQVDAPRADALVRELTGRRIRLRAELAPEPLDEADRRMLAALGQPRRLDEIWPLSRAPRFRLLALVHFLRAVDALDADPAPDARTASRATAPSPPAPAGPRHRALVLLGLDDAADAEHIKRAYRRLARALHPDLQPGADDRERRALERRFAEVTAAYDALR